MESKTQIKEKNVYKVNLFYTLTLIWSLIAEFLPISSNLYQYVAFLIPIFIYIFLNKKDAKKILKFNKINMKSFFIIFFIWIFMLPISILIISLYTDIFGNTMPDLILEESRQSTLEILLFTAITPSILEEILMRGIVLYGYRNKNRFSAAVTNGFMFGILHLNLFQFSHTFFSGIIATYLVFATNSIFAPMFLHFVNNSSPIFMEFLFSQDTEDIQVNSNLDYKTLIIIAIVSLLIIITLIKLLAKINKIDFKKKINTSNETILNKPLIISIIIFVIINFILFLSIKFLM